jgi:predicted dienelactone hydrolase
MPALRALIFCLPLLAMGEPAYHAGVTERSIQPQRSIYNWRGARTHSLVTTIWYPVETSVPAEPRWIGAPDAPFASAGRAAPNAEMTKNPTSFPLILLSHGTGGSSLMLAWLGTRLAEEGFLAAAVNHPGNNALEPYTPEGFALWWERATDISEVLSALLADVQFGSRIDPSRVGAAGFSLGGFTAIELAGGIGTHARFEEFCKSDQADEICRSQLEFPDLNEKVAAVAGTEEFQASVRDSSRSHRDPRIRAVFAIAPAIGPAFLPGDLRKIRIPVAIVSGSADHVVPVESSARFFTKYIPGASLSLYPGAAHYTFLATCTESGRKAQPVLCGDAPGVDRDAVHARATTEAVRFFRTHLPPAKPRAADQPPAR